MWLRDFTKKYLTYSEKNLGENASKVSGVKCKG